MPSMTVAGDTWSKRLAYDTRVEFRASASRQMFGRLQSIGRVVTSSNYSRGVSPKPGRRRGVGRPLQAQQLTRREILDAAVDVFAVRGLSGTTLRDVSAAAGITAGALHHHFPSKTRLYA